MHLREFSSDKYSSLTQLLALNLNLIFPTVRSGIIFLIIITITITIIMTISTDHTAVAILEKKLERHAMFNRGRPEPSSGKSLFGKDALEVIVSVSQ